MMKRALRFALLFCSLAMFGLAGCASKMQEIRYADQVYTQTLFLTVEAVGLVEEAVGIAVEYDVAPPENAQAIRREAAEILVGAEISRDASFANPSTSGYTFPFRMNVLPPEAMKEQMAYREAARNLLIEAQFDLIRVQNDAGVMVLIPEVLVPVESG